MYNHDTIERIKTALVETITVAGLWVALFTVNGWLFSSAEASKYVSWIFLPAALRILSVMVLDWDAVPGLFLGAMITNQLLVGSSVSTSLTLSFISALSPLLAIRVSTSWLKLSTDLAGIHIKQLILISGTGAFTSAIAHNTYFLLSNPAHKWMGGIVPMLCGDMLGTCVILYLSSAVLRLMPEKKL
jgi:hypothetical protein